MTRTPGTDTANTNADALAAAADAILKEPATVERISAESWDAIIDGAAPWDEQDEYTKELHTATVQAVIAAINQGNPK